MTTGIDVPEEAHCTSAADAPPGRSAHAVQPWPALQWPAEPQRIAHPTRRDRILIRVLIVAALATLAGFLAWLCQPSHVGDAAVFWPLSVALGLVVLGWLFEWSFYWQIEAPPHRIPGRAYTVDVFTTACPGEPLGMVARTLVAMQKITYPHASYLCDESNNPLLRDLCDQLGVVHLTRNDRQDAKAGNINNALRHSDGEICVVIDPDHEPAPYLLDRVLGHFDDPEIGFVQTIQAYRNQGSSWIARAAAETSYHFYGPLLMGMHGRGTPQAIGANCVFRRSALESIGGHAPGLAEDMHTAMHLFSRGWKSVYVPEALTRGLIPATLAAFYKQQLKWSCGVFDLLIGSYAKLFRGFSFWQKLYFFFAPAYYLRGWTTLVSILVPIACLLTGATPLRVDLGHFLAGALPLLLLVTLVRQAVQRFLLEPGEPGLHVSGGVLSLGTWWIFVLGNLFSFLRRSVPYIPTPKEETSEDSWKLAAPNLVAAGVCCAAAAYGLAWDQSPYSAMMALLAGANATALVWVALAGQQRTLRALRARLPRTRFLHTFFRPIRRTCGRTHDAILTGMRRWTVAPALITVLATAGVLLALRPGLDGAGVDEIPAVQRDVGGFHFGIYLAQLDDAGIERDLMHAEALLDARLRIVSLYQAWGPWSLEHFPERLLRRISEAGRVPMITWEPFTHGFPGARRDADLAHNRRVFRGILEGRFDDYIIAYADRVARLGHPVLMRFGHEPDNPQYPWSHVGGNTPDEFAAAFRYVEDVFDNRGATNVGWVYSPWTSAAVERYYPGDGYVDWIGLTLLNYGRAGKDPAWHGFQALYEPFRPKLLQLGIPVMLAEFGSTRFGGDQASWLGDALGRIANDYSEIRSVVFFHSDKDENWATDWRPDDGAERIDWTFLEGDAGATPVVRAALRAPRFGAPEAGALSRRAWHPRRSPLADQPTPISGSHGSFSLEVDGRPFYVRGIAYNLGHGWRSGHLPPTRRQLDEDFRRIKAMGANTVRRYGSGWYDTNVFHAARDHELRVLYGFWFEPDVDYLTDVDRLAEYEREVLDNVRRYRNEPALLGWTLGNEVWGLLAHRFGQPYLTDVRHAYTRFIERLARKIRELDPEHVVLAVHEHNHELPGALLDFAVAAPSLHAIGVNSYYEQNLARLGDAMARLDPGRPYLVSEFGPDGYWHADYTRRNGLGGLLEASASEKAQLYERRWREHIEARRGANLGGVAFCWRDRYEGTSSWFGLNRLDGRPKPAFFALRHAWTGLGAEPGPILGSLTASRDQGLTGQPVELHAEFDPRGAPVSQAHWSVLDTGFREVDARIRSSERDAHLAWLTLPERPGWIRVHLTVLDAEGHLDERSVPILVRDTGDAWPTRLASEPSRAGRPHPDLAAY